MKKNLLILAVAGLALASCSNDETVAVNNNDAKAINFRPFVSGVTRAASNSFAVSNTNAQFKVTAFEHNTETTPYFAGVDFKGDGTSYWVSDNKYYWPETYNLDFYAYAPIDGAPVNAVNQVTPDNTYPYKKFTITPSTTIASQVDFIYANTNQWGKKYESGYHSGKAGVTMNFRHTGSKVNVMVKNSSSALKFEITGMKIVNVDGSAVFTYNTPDANNSGATDRNTDGAGHLQYVDWSDNNDSYTITYATPALTTNTIAASTTTAVYLGSNGTTSTSTADENISMILIPQRTTKATAYSATTANAAITTGSYIALKMVVKDISNHTIADCTADNKWAIWPVSFTWNPGYIYTYTIELSGGGYWESNVNGDNDTLDEVLDGTEIKFVTVTVDGWTDGGNTDVGM